MLVKRVNVYSIVFFLLLHSISFGQTIGKLDSLKGRIGSSSITELPGLYMDIFVASLTDYDSAIKYSNLAIETSLNVGDSLNYARGLYALGYIYKELGRYEESADLNLKAYNVSSNNGFTDREKASLNNLAICYYQLSKFDLSLRYNLQSLQLREKDGNDTEIAIACNNIGLVYYQLSDYNKSLLYFQRAIAIKEKNNSPDVYGTYNNIALSYIGIKKFDLALSNLQKTIDLCESGCNNQVLVEAYDSRGFCYLKLGMIKEAKTDYLMALNIAKQDGLEVKMSSIYYGLARNYSYIKDFETSKNYTDSSFYLASKLNLRSIINDCYSFYAALYAEQSDFEKALEYQVLYDSMSKQLMNEKIAKNLLDVQVKYEERENLEIIELQNREINRRTTLLLMSIISSVLTIMVVLLLYRNNKVRKRVNKRLGEANETIEEQNKILVSLNADLEERVKERTDELRASNEALIKSNLELDNFIYKTSHDIRGPLATLQGVCNIALMDIKDPMAVDYFQKLSKTAVKLNNILSKLLIVNQINNSLPNQEEFNLKLLVEEIVDNNKIGYIKKDIEVLVKGEDRFTIVSDYELMKIIVTSIINNAFKFHNPSNNVSSFVEINFLKNKSQLLLTVIDNGLGIDESISDQIFDIFSKTSEIQDSAGMGLYLAKLAVDKLEGEIHVSKTEQGYTNFTVNIPLN